MNKVDRKVRKYLKRAEEILPTDKFLSNDRRFNTGGSFKYYALIIEIVKIIQREEK